MATNEEIADVMALAMKDVVKTIATLTEEVKTLKAQIHHYEDGAQDELRKHAYEVTPSSVLVAMAEHRLTFGNPLDENDPLMKMGVKETGGKEGGIADLL